MSGFRSSGRWGRRAAIAAAVTAGCVAGWAGWMAFRPRPPLAAFVPAGARVVIAVRGAGSFFAALEDLDRRGALLGPQGAVTRGLRVIGSAGRRDLIEEIGRDEAVAAILPGGRWLIVFRPGAREAVADRVMSVLGLTRKDRAPGAWIRTVRLPDGSRLGWALRAGVAFVASDAAAIREALAGPAAPPESEPAPTAAHVRVTWGGRVATLRATRDGLRVRVILPAGRIGAGPPVPTRPARLDRMPPALAVVDPPDPDLVAMVAPAAGRRVRDAIRAAAFTTGIDARRLAALRPVIAWLGVDRRGIVPMPQLAAVFPGAADLVNAPLAARLDARLRAASHDRFRLEPAGQGWVVNFPVTRTLAPALAVAGDDAVIATSVASLETMLAAAPPPDRGEATELLRAPAHAALAVDLAGLAAEARLTEAGLREYGLLSPAADRIWTRHGEAWAAAAETLGGLVITVRLDGDRLILDGATVPPLRPAFLLAARPD